MPGPEGPNPTDVGGEVQTTFEADLGHALIQELALTATYLPVRQSSPRRPPSRRQPQLDCFLASPRVIDQCS